MRSVWEAVRGTIVTQLLIVLLLGAILYKIWPEFYDYLIGLGTLLLLLAIVLGVILIGIIWYADREAVYQAEQREKQERAKHVKIVQAHLKSCNEGNAKNCKSLGIIYERGEGTQKDIKTAIIYYQKACDAGDFRTCGFLAFRYFEGVDAVERNYAEALRLSAKACNNNIGESCALLGTMHYVGNGVPQNKNEGTRLLIKACSLNVDWACYRIKNK